MIYLFENPNKNASVVYDESTLAEEEKRKGVAVEELPEPETPNGKVAILKVKKSTGEIWYEYEDAPTNEIDDLKARLEATETALLNLILEGGGL